MVVKRVEVLPVSFSCYKKTTKRNSFFTITKNTEVQELHAKSWNTSLKLTIPFLKKNSSINN